jgi:hypothetical protein
MPYKTVDAMGRPTGKLRTRNKLKEQFVPHVRSMLESPAWIALSITARRILDRLELEHMAHAGKENGKLVCTYDDFVKYGAGRKYIAPAILELRSLGFIEVTQWGRQAVGDGRLPSKYRLTYVPTVEPYYQATNEWRRFEHEAAVMVGLKRARDELEQRRERSRRRRSKNKTRVVKRAPVPVVKRVLVAKTGPDKTQGKSKGAQILKPRFPVVKRELLSISIPYPPSSVVQYAGLGAHKYTLSTDPAAFQQFGTIEYRGRLFEIAPNNSAAA